MRRSGFILSLFILLPPPFSFFRLLPHPFQLRVALRHLYTQRTTARYDYYPTTKMKNTITNVEGQAPPWRRQTIFSMFTSYHYHTYTTTILSSLFCWCLTTIGQIFYFILSSSSFPPKKFSTGIPGRLDARLLLLPPPIITVPFAFSHGQKVSIITACTLHWHVHILVLILSSLASISFFPVFYFPPHVYYYYYYTISTGWMGWFRWHFSCGIGYWSLDLKPQWKFDITVQLLPCVGREVLGGYWRNVGAPHMYYYYYTTSTGWMGWFRLI